MQRLAVLAFAVVSAFSQAAPAFNWNVQKITYKVNPGVVFSVDLSKHVDNPGNLDLEYSAMSNPSYITVGREGILQAAIPSKAAPGRTVFTLAVKATGAHDGGALTTFELVVENAAPPKSLTCADGSKAYLVGSLEDKSQDLFACPR